MNHLKIFDLGKSHGGHSRRCNKKVIMDLKDCGKGG